MKKVYHVIVEINDDYGKMRLRLLFPSVSLRKTFCLTHRTIVSVVGRRPLIAAKGDLERTRMNIGFYAQLRDFVPIWDQHK